MGPGLLWIDHRFRRVDTSARIPGGQLLSPDDNPFWADNSLFYWDGEGAPSSHFVVLSPEESRTESFSGAVPASGGYAIFTARERVGRRLSRQANPLVAFLSTLPTGAER